VGDHWSREGRSDPCNYARMGEDTLAALSLLGYRVVYCYLKDTRT